MSNWKNFSSFVFFSECPNFTFKNVKFHAAFYLIDVCCIILIKINYTSVALNTLINYALANKSYLIWALRWLDFAYILPQVGNWHGKILSSSLICVFGGEFFLQKKGKNKSIYIFSKITFYTFFRL